MLPFKPFVEYNHDNMPIENLFSKQNESKVNNVQCCEKKNECSKNKKITDQISFFIEQVSSFGFNLLKFTKLPYLCEGNLSQSYYFMYDYVFLFKVKNF